MKKTAVFIFYRVSFMLNIEPQTCLSGRQGHGDTKKHKDASIRLRFDKLSDQANTAAQQPRFGVMLIEYKCRKRLQENIDKG